MKHEKKHTTRSSCQPGDAKRVGFSRGEDPLADRTHRLLRQLPGRPAPATFAPQVLAALARRAQLAWYRRPWPDWPEGLRWLSTLALAGLVAGVLHVIEGGWVANQASPALTAVYDVPVLFQAAESSGRSFVSLLKALPPTWWLVGGSTLGIICASTLGLGTAAWRLARSASR